MASNGSCLVPRGVEPRPQRGAIASESPSWLSTIVPVVILSGNSIEHALLALGGSVHRKWCARAGRAVRTGSAARDFTTLRALWDSLNPGVVSPAEGQLPFARALKAVVVTELWSTSFDELVKRRRHRPSTMRTRGSAGRRLRNCSTWGSLPDIRKARPQMLCAILRTVLPLLADEPPVLCDLRSWNRSAATLSLVLDTGKPTPAALDISQSVIPRNRNDRVSCRAGFKYPRPRASAPTPISAVTSSAG